MGQPEPQSVSLPLLGGLHVLLSGEAWQQLSWSAFSNDRRPSWILACFCGGWPPWAAGIDLMLGWHSFDWLGSFGDQNRLPRGFPSSHICAQVVVGALLITCQV
mmetsp:Transcript_117786/g.293727  ORF Transcript_117786/g.293727 Transcript_117786/m.293727 type:complete len:104 (+) Transcript_117786:1919-2230(+)